MSENNSLNEPDSISNQIKAKIVQQVEIAEILNKLIRVRILLLLWSYKELSTTDICEKLGKSWPTISKHVKKLEEAGLLEIREVSARGKYNKRLYSVKPDILALTRLDPDVLKTLNPSEMLEILKNDIISDAHTVQILIKIFEDLIPYYEELSRYLREMNNPSILDLEMFYKKKHMNYYVETLDNEEFEFYLKKQEEILEELENFRKRRRNKGIELKISRPYAILHAILPIKEILEARYRRIWKK